jgi:hypothetical protein
MVFAHRVGTKFSTIRSPGVTSAIIQRSQKPLIPFSRLKEFYTHPDAFYWLVWTFPTTSRWKTVRSWVTRRVNNAMTEALRERGFDRLGRRIITPGLTHHGEATAKPLPDLLPDLTGMVVVKPLPAAVTIRYEELKKEMGQAVDEIAKTCSKR